MRSKLAGILVVAAVVLAMDAATPAAAIDQFSVPDYRSNYVWRPWGPRYVRRFPWYDSYHTVILGPRYHYRLRRAGIDLQLRDPWVARVEPHREGLK